MLGADFNLGGFLNSYFLQARKLKLFTWIVESPGHYQLVQESESLTRLKLSLSVTDSIHLESVHSLTSGS